MINEQKNTEAFTSVFSFIHYLKTNNAGDVIAINTATTSQGISNVADIYGTGESHNGGHDINLPIYQTATVGNKISNVCVANINGNSNKLAIRRYVKFIATKQSNTITVTQTNAGSSDPYIILSETKPFLKLGTFDSSSSTEQQGTYNKYKIGTQYLYEIVDFKNKYSCYDVTIN